MQYGFVINQETCIGCHACTVACKAENDVPVGGFRTNVKYVETGRFPHVKRSFLVQRCNHCTEAPCVAICPVNALTKRLDGIVDVDRDACIGCRACMQACPYDALYLNEDLGSVEKCHFCAHRIEKGLQPACVTVCPVGAIIPGDFDDPESDVSLIRKAQALSARRPEQGTGPNVHYLGANEAALNPGIAARPSHYLWSERRQTGPEPWPAGVSTEPDAREVLNADPRIEWGWPVALYLLTKGIAGGAAMIAPFLLLIELHRVPWWAPETIGLFFMLVTVFLLVEDLAKPLHFYKLFTRPNWNSWLVKGGIVLTAFGGISALILFLGFFGAANKVHSAIQGLRVFNCALGALVSGYTAFLFKQCKGRDLWEADGLLWHLLAQSVTAAAGFFLVAGMGNAVTVGAFALGSVALGSMHFIPPSEKDRTDNFLQAKGFLHEARFGKLRIANDSAWLFPVLGVLALATLGFPDTIAFAILRGVFAGAVLALLFQYERAFVRAGQLAPLS